MNEDPITRDLYRPNLGIIRFKHNISQLDLAKEAKVSQTCVSLWENGYRLPVLSSAWSVVKALHALTGDESIGFADVWPAS